VLSRVYIHNFRCFVNFEYRPRRTELIMGANGTGKSSLIEFVGFLAGFATGGILRLPTPRDTTRWASLGNMVGELEARLETGTYVYRLELGFDRVSPRVIEESVQRDGRPLFRFLNGQVQLFNERLEAFATFGSDPRRTAMPTAPGSTDPLLPFRNWLARLCWFKLNPFAMLPLSELEALGPDSDLSNLASWYRHLRATEPELDAKFTESLRESLDMFRVLPFEPAGRGLYLTAEFGADSNGKPRYDFNELSDGQRCVIALYMILHFLIARGGTVIIDEPDNFVGLREIQPWLTAARMMAEDCGGQLLIASHHPEILNDWASTSVRLSRESGGHVRIEPFAGDPDLKPAELVARGWDGN
jgi:predicted ATPase